MAAFIDEQREKFGVEPVCRELPIAPSTYYEFRACELDPSRLPQRRQRDAELNKRIEKIWQESGETYGARKVWQELRREGRHVARCTVERLMRGQGLRGVKRGGWKQTTEADPGAAVPPDLVERQFSAEGPNRLWVADFTYVPLRQGFVFTAFVVDVFAGMIVGWKVDGHMRTELVLAALEQALCTRTGLQGLVHHSDHGKQYLSELYSQSLAEAGIMPSAGSVGDPYDNAMAESIIGLYKTELISRQRRWPNREAVEFATLKWVHWFNTKRLYGRLGYMPPREFEGQWYSRQQSRNTGSINT